MTGSQAKQTLTRITKHSPICAVDGCTRPYYAKHHCRLHWERLRATGATEALRSSHDTPLKERLARHSRRVGDCIEWKGYRDRDGYGGFTVGRKYIRAHRAAYIVHNGDIPEGLIIRHTCDNPPCINPDHLIAGTDADNVADRSARGRSAVGTQNGTARLTDAKVIEIRRLRNQGMPLKELAARFGVGDSTISRVVNRTHWKHIRS